VVGVLGGGGGGFLWGGWGGSIEEVFQKFFLLVFLSCFPCHFRPFPLEFSLRYMGPAVPPENFLAQRAAAFVDELFRPP